MKRYSFALAALAAGFVLQLSCFGQAPARVLTSFDEKIMPAVDDFSAGPISPGFSLNFNGKTFNDLYVNTNGNITFGSSEAAYSPFPITGSSKAMIAAFFADVDPTSGNLVTYGTGKLGAYNAFAVNWLDVNVFGVSGPTNSFQLVLIDRSDTGAGNFDIELNYQRILWEAGKQSNSDNSGLGGTTARVGYTNGAGTAFEFTGSGVPGYFLDSSATGLIHGKTGTPVDGAVSDGRYTFSVRSGAANTPDAASTLVLAAFGLGALSTAGRWCRR